TFADERVLTIRPFFSSFTNNVNLKARFLAPPKTQKVVNTEVVNTEVVNTVVMAGEGCCRYLADLEDEATKLEACSLGDQRL
ncbi:Hypothetical predicted protein, partial [Marmota monax]